MINQTAVKNQIKEKALVICPGRGSYTKETLGYFRQFQNDPNISTFISRVDQMRESVGFPSVTEMDEAKTFNVGLHTPGENASPLISTCAIADFMSIDRERYDIVAVTGNSMGWYLALSCAGALREEQSFEVVQTMGAMMKDKVIGGQMIYPIMDEEWRLDREKENMVMQKIDQVNTVPGCAAYISIYLGGFLVIAGTVEALAILQKDLPAVDHYPFKLVNHAAFHTPLLAETSRQAFQLLPEFLFSAPRLPLIDGRGKIWMPYSTDIAELYDYTLGHQVIAPYDFSTCISVAMKEFAPSKIILLGPGNSLGGVVGQILIENEWQGIRSKRDFLERQKRDPLLLSMGLADQRIHVVASHLK